MDIDDDDAFLYGDEPEQQPQSIAQAQAQAHAQAEAAKESAISASMAAYVCFPWLFPLPPRFHRLFHLHHRSMPHSVAVADVLHSFETHSDP